MKRISHKNMPRHTARKDSVKTGALSISLSDDCLSLLIGLRRCMLSKTEREQYTPRIDEQNRGAFSLFFCLRMSNLHEHKDERRDGCCLR